MFTSGTDSSQDPIGIVGTVLIPTRFVWPHGGRRVLLTGSFSRWSDHIPMSPVEDCPNVFQAIYPLTPGVHQYKFYVDGEWRHDENQPYVTGNYGIVNTLFVTREPEPVQAMYTSMVPVTRMNMEVDNEQFRRVVAVSGGSMQERISEADVVLSRHSISTFLSSHTAYDLLPDSGKVIALDINLPVKQAFHILYEQGIPVAPLWDFYRGQFVGVLSALDFILILKELGNHGSNLTEEELETHTISAWKEGKQQLYGQIDEHGRPFQRHLIHAGPYDSLKDVALKILQNEVATVPIINSSTPDGSFPQLLHLASLAGILRCICRHFRHSSSSLPILQQPICAIPLGTWVPKIGESNRSPLAMLRPNASLSSALSLLVQDNNSKQQWQQRQQQEEVAAEATSSDGGSNTKWKAAEETASDGAGAATASGSNSKLWKLQKTTAGTLIATTGSYSNLCCGISNSKWQKAAAWTAIASGGTGVASGCGGNLFFRPKRKRSKTSCSGWVGSDRDLFQWHVFLHIWPAYAAYATYAVHYRICRILDHTVP